MEIAALLKQLSVWRKQFVVELSQSNPQLDRLTLQHMTQEVIYRCLTLQICNDRGIQPLQEWLQPIPAVDSQRGQLAMQQLYEFKRSCQLSALPIELLGHLYEQFLTIYEGTTRKKQGVYYTPVSIVDCMINSTLVSQLQGKTVEDLCDRPLHILDPACGSGVFLLRAYQYLLDWYRTQYLTKLKQYQTYCKQCSGEWQLTPVAKQQILLRHIFGVDINPYAVEVTKRSLLLQMLAGSSTENQGQQPDYFVNPKNLQFNIQCGNAIVDLDYYQFNQQQFTDAEFKQINAFNWESAFPEVTQFGGFEVILGNPPWVFTRRGEFDNRIKRYYRQKFLSPLASTQRGKAKQTGKINLAVLFLFKCLELLHRDGKIGIVVPNTLLRTTVYETVRKHILDHCSIEQIVDLGSEAFSGVTASATILVLGKDLAHSTVQLAYLSNTGAASNTIEKSDFLRNTTYVFSIFINSAQNKLFQKISAVSVPLKSLTHEIIEGIVCRKNQIQPYQEEGIHHRILEGKDVTRYCISFREKYFAFDRKQLHRPRPDYVWSAKEKIILRRIAGGKSALIAALDTEYYYTFASTNNILLKDNHLYNIRYILALLNSQLLNYYYIQQFTNQSKLTVNISKTFLEQLPIRSIDFDCAAEKLQHDRIVAQAEYLQTLHRQQQVTKTSTEYQDLYQQIQAVDQQIDQWVYELYNLTELEIDLIKTPA